MADQMNDAFSFAQDTSKQVLVLATGIITITVALLGSLKKVAPPGALTNIHWAWILDGVSVLAGVLTLMALTGHLSRNPKPPTEAIYAANVRILYLAQFASFIAALVFTVAFGIDTA